ncbi:hypothetical protein JB92DRAFT_491358 [Gautieria morchelliformis]|nr:hypothetical protein JB92DRAFT_491358 [Gautieria morchelliformis]
MRANQQSVDHIPPRPDNRLTTTFAMSSAETPWEGNDGMDIKPLTEVIYGGEVNEEPQAPLDQLTRGHINRLTDHRRRLEPTRPHSSRPARLICISCMRGWSTNALLHARVSSTRMVSVSASRPDAPAGTRVRTARGWPGQFQRRRCSEGSTWSEHGRPDASPRFV